MSDVAEKSTEFAGITVSEKGLTIAGKEIAWWIVGAVAIALIAAVVIIVRKLKG